MSLLNYKKVTTAARELNTSRPTIYAWIAKDILTGVKIDNTVHIVIDEKYNQIKEERGG